MSCPFRGTQETSLSNPACYPGHHCSLLLCAAWTCQQVSGSVLPLPTLPGSPGLLAHVFRVLIQSNTPWLRACRVPSLPSGSGCCRSCPGGPSPPAAPVLGSPDWEWSGWWSRPWTSHPSRGLIYQDEEPQSWLGDWSINYFIFSVI